MSRVIITKSLFIEIQKTFSKREAEKILSLLESVELNPKKGKVLSSVGGVVIKELKYRERRFYFITDGQILKFGSEDELTTLLIKFIRMSTKKNQQIVINQIKKTLESLGFDSF